MATLLTNMGIPCMHEGIFTVQRDKCMRHWIEDHGDMLGESSWLAAPRIAELPNFVAVIHVIRPFVDFMPSLKALTLTSNDPSGFHARTFQNYMRQYIPEMFSVPAGDGRLALFYQEWNKLIEGLCRHPNARRHYWRVEIDELTPEELQRFFQMALLINIPDHVRDEAWVTTPRNINTHIGRTL